MTIDLLERGAAALGDLVDQVAFVGGATIVLWITDPGAPAPRPTKDVDVVIEVTTPNAFHDFQARLRARGFHEDIDSGVICRWRYNDGSDDLILDAMPSAGELLGFENPWQTAAMPHAARRAPHAAIRREYPRGHSPYLIATKLAAFSSRGRGDHLGSRDLEDAILLVDGREELVAEVAEADDDVRAFIATELAMLLRQARFVDAIFVFLRADMASQARAETVVLPRLHAIAGG